MSTAETLDVPVGVSPLSSRTIVVTRPKAQAAELADSLKALGADVRLIPTIAIEPPSDPAPLEFAARGETVYDWVIFTSANGVGALREAADRAGIGLGRVVGVGRVCCIGPATARAAEGAGLVVSVIPVSHSGCSLVNSDVRLSETAGSLPHTPSQISGMYDMPSCRRCIRSPADIRHLVRSRCTPSFETSKIASTCEA